MKKLIPGIVAVVIVAVIAIVALGSGLDALVKKAINKYGSEATQTAVSVSGVHLSLKDGVGSLSGLTVGNPKGFSGAKALSLGGISVKLDTASVAGTGPIVIDDVTVEKPEVTFEMNAAGQSNLKAIGDNAQNYGGKKEEASAADAKAARKVVIKQLTIKDGQIAIVSPLLKDKKLSADLPELRLSNIGGKKGGATPAEVASLIASTLSSTATSVALPSLTKELGNLKNVTGEAAKGALNGAAGVAGGATDAAKATTDTVGGAVKGLLGK